MKKLISLLLVLVLALSCVAALAEDTGKHLNAALYWFGTSLDPHYDYDGWTVMRAGIGETLVTVDENLNIVGQLADSWEMTDDCTWVMHIRDGVTFHNGKAVDGEAVKLSIERTMETQERGKTACKIKSVEADGQTVTFTTEEPFGAFLANLSEPLYTIIDVTADTDPATCPIATGPFMVTGFTVDEEIQLKRYDGYWNGASDIETMTIYNIADNTTRATALQSGTIDIMQRVAAADMPLFEGNSDYALYDCQGVRIYTLIVNHARPLMADYNIRKAIATGINYEALPKILGAGVSVAGAPYPVNSAYFGEDMTPTTYDAEAAKAALAEGGYEDTDGNGYVEKDGEEVVLTISYDSATMTSAMEALQDMLKQIGLHIELNFMESTAELESSHDFDMMLRNIQSLSTGDPQWLVDTMYYSGKQTNWGSYANAELDAVVDKMTAAFEPEERQALALEAEKLLMADYANIWLVATDNYVVSSSKVSGVTSYPIDYYFITNAVTIGE